MLQSTRAGRRLKNLIATALLLAAVPATALAQAHCSREVLSVRATPVTIDYCVSGPVVRSPGGELAVPIRASYSAVGGSFTQNTVLRFVSSEGPALVLQSVPLARLGIAGTLHLTLDYVGAGVRIQSAMLTPGAITIK